MENDIDVFAIWKRKMSMLNEEYRTVWTWTYDEGDEFLSDETGLFPMNYRNLKWCEDTNIYNRFNYPHSEAYLPLNYY